MHNIIYKLDNNLSILYTMNKKVIKMLDNKTKIIKKIISDNKCLDKILEANSNDEVKQVFEGEGLYLTDSQIENLKKVFEDQIINLCQIDDESLEKIGGGKDYKNAAYKGGGYGGAYGMWVGAGIGAAAGVVDASIKAYRGGVDTTWGFMKEAFKIAVKSSLVGGAAGGGLGILSGALHNVGEQGSADLKK